VTGAEPAETSAGPADAPRTRTPWRAAFFALAGLGLIAGLAWVLFGSRLLVVRSVAVTGTHSVPAAEVLAAADVQAGTPLIRVNTGQIARRVEAIRQVASATVARDWPDHLVITVRERVPVVAVRMAGGGYDLVDSDGVIVRWSQARPAGLPLYLTPLPGHALRGDSALATTAAVLAELPSWLSRQLATVSAATADGGPGSPDQVMLYLDGHKTVRWGGPDGATQKGKELAILIREPASYFDVSAPGTVVTK